MRRPNLAGVVAVGLGLFAPAAAHAQYTKQTCCDGKKTLPVFDKHYIKKYCGPTINAGTCFGFYQTKWTAWHEACPGSEPANLDVRPEVLPPGGTPPAPTTPPAATPAPATAPKADPVKPDPVKPAPLQVPSLPVVPPPAGKPNETLPPPKANDEKPRNEASAERPAGLPAGLVTVKIPDVNVVPQPAGSPLTINK